MQTKEIVVKADLSQEELDIVDRILISRDTLSVAIPDDTDPDAVWRTLTACSKALTVYRNAASTLKLVVGRLLMVVQDHPELYLGKYKNYNSFVSQGCPELFGVPRSEAYAAKSMVEAWPSLTVDEIKQIKFSKLAHLTFKCQITEKSPNADKYLELAQTHTLNELKDITASNGIIPRDEADMAGITIVTTLATKNKWEQFISNPQIRAYVGSDNAGIILHK